MQTLFRPVFLAAYSAWSARSIQSDRRSPGS